MKRIAVLLFVGVVLLGAGTAYGLGGGGSNGDGRMDYRQGSGAAGSPAIGLSNNATQAGDWGNAAVEAAHASSRAGGSVYGQSTPQGQSDPANGATQVAVSVPESASALLLGCALIGLARLRKRVERGQMKKNERRVTK